MNEAYPSPEKAESPAQLPSRKKPLAKRLMRALLAVPISVGVAVTAPAAFLAPKAFARLFDRYRAAVSLLVLLLLWQLLTVSPPLLYAIGYDAATFVVYGASPLRPGAVLQSLHDPWETVDAPGARGAVALLPISLYGVVIYAICVSIARPLAARWDEPEKQTSRRGSAVAVGLLTGMVGFTLLAFGCFDGVLAWIAGAGPSRPEEFYRVYSRVLGTSAWMGVLASIFTILSLAQIVRGAASVGGGELPRLEPLCQGCGYNLQGVAEVYLAGLAGKPPERARVTVCSECGLDLGVSLRPDVRAGTEWTRGENVSLLSWARNFLAATFRPGKFFSTLPLQASRRAAVRFFLMNLTATVAAVLLAGAVGTWFAVRVAHVAPLLEPFSASRSGSLLDRKSLGEILLILAGILAWITIPGCILLSSFAYRLGRQMTRLRERNMQPVGGLAFCYFSGLVLLCGVLIFLAVCWGKPLIALAWRGCPSRIRSSLGGTEFIVIPLILAILLGLLLWYWLATRRTSQAIRYASK